MNGNKEIGLVLVGYGSPFLQRNESVIPSRQYNFCAEPVFKQPLQLMSDLKNQVLLLCAPWAYSPRIMTAMTRIKHDPSDLQPEDAGERAVPSARGCRCSRQGGRIRWRRQRG